MLLPNLGALYPWTVAAGRPGEVALLAAGAAVLVVLLAGLATRPRALLLAAAALPLPFYLFFVRILLSRQYAGLLFIGAVASLWLARLEGEGRAWGPPGLRRAGGRLLAAGQAGLGAVAIVSAGFGAVDLVQDWRLAYSGSRAMGRWIRDAGLAGVPMAGFPDGVASALLPYLPGTRMFYTGSQRRGTYIVQDAPHKKGDWVTYQTALVRSFDEYRAEPRFLFLIERELKNLPPRYWAYGSACRLLHAVRIDEVLHDERYHLYECQPAKLAGSGRRPGS
jgi:hypothetical protein